MEDDLKNPETFLLAYNQSTQINLVGCDTIVNSPSFMTLYVTFISYKEGEGVMGDSYC